MIYEHMENLSSLSTAIFVLPIKRGLKRFIPVLQCLHDVYMVARNSIHLCYKKMFAGRLQKILSF
jgi:hypothetical protein